MWRKPKDGMRDFAERIGHTLRKLFLEMGIKSFSLFGSSRLYMAPPRRSCVQRIISDGRMCRSAMSALAFNDGLYYGL